MGRYTTVQTYTDQDAKVAAISYSTATTVSSSSSSADALEAVAAGAGGLEPAKQPEVPSDESKFHTNRVENVSGSSAGAGSGDFHMYRASRRRCVRCPLSLLLLEPFALLRLRIIGSWNEEALH